MALIVISLVCLILMSIIIVFNIINCLNNNNKIKTLLFGLLYICIIPLFMVGTLNNNSNVWYAFVEALQLTINIIVLKFDYNVVISLINDSKLYEVFVNIAFVLCIINSIWFVISLSFEKISRLFSYIKCRLSKRIYIVVGYNKYTKYFIDTISDKHYCVVLLYSSNEYEIYNKNHELSSYLTTKKIYGCLYNQNLESLVKKVVKKVLIMY